jgi:hypothetical protein
MQRGAFARLDLHRMLMERATLEAVEPDVHLVAKLLSLRHVMPAITRRDINRWAAENNR